MPIVRGLLGRLRGRREHRGPREDRIKRRETRMAEYDRSIGYSQRRSLRQVSSPRIGVNPNIISGDKAQEVISRMSKVPSERLQLEFLAVDFSPAPYQAESIVEFKVVNWKELQKEGFKEVQEIYILTPEVVRKHGGGF